MDIEGVSWTGGVRIRNDRYSLSKQVATITVPIINPDGSRSIRIELFTGDSFKMMVSPDGTVEGYHNASQFTGKGLDEVIGKELAKKIMDIPYVYVDFLKKGDRVTINKNGKQVEVTVNPERRMSEGTNREGIMVTSTDGKGK